ncbi:MAG: L-rhamnose mutarotase [Bacteroidaceae bacterium]|jgi:L-rhamnose mutarotase|nr:L-rhamnose mutarotase [Bacteroidaceae bacterium]MBQ2293682.1 L-rhamnose mutarotase [Bacteroidaceae bacterium]MBQ2300564.1 L-rhamnose mutarotase [Bacteroidaceae bacterium]MBQ5680746.1 L-rhamnose mutarotase [Bacteroidaceae bacterium]MBQ5870848.1 L-rhamnose mutarotase [Bacteroidaceae bacterium]
MGGYIQKQHTGNIKRFVQTLTLNSDEEARREYIKWHSPEHNWKEIRNGIREVGIIEMEIYILGNTLVMIVDTPEDFDWEKAMARLATLPRQAEWEAFVSQFQGCNANATSDEKWQMMQRIFFLYD